MSSTPPANTLRLHIGPDEGGQRLDRVVADWRGLSRAQVLRLLDIGALSHNGRPLRRKDKGLVLYEDSVLELAAEYAQRESPRPDPELPLGMLAQGEGWLAVNKPAGVPVRPHALDEVGTVINAVAAREPRLAEVGEGGLRSGVVHRLDTDTSGALVVATRQSAWKRLRKLFAEHEVDKRYEALVLGRVPEEGDLDLVLGVARHAPAEVRVYPPDTSGDSVRLCSLEWRVLERFGDDANHVQIKLGTGYLHQIRVMMAHMGWPILGDKQYGPKQPAIAAPRQMLHARSLSFEDVVVEAPLPDDFVRTIVALRSRKNDAD